MNKPVNLHSSRYFKIKLNKLIKHLSVDANTLLKLCYVCAWLHTCVGVCAWVWEREWSVCHFPWYLTPGESSPAHPPHPITDIPVLVQWCTRCVDLLSLSHTHRHTLCRLKTERWLTVSSIGPSGDPAQIDECTWLLCTSRDSNWQPSHIQYCELHQHHQVHLQVGFMVENCQYP